MLSITFDKNPIILHKLMRPSDYSISKQTKLKWAGWIRILVRIDCLREASTSHLKLSLRAAMAYSSASNPFSRIQMAGPVKSRETQHHQSRIWWEKSDKPLFWFFREKRCFMQLRLYSRQTLLIVGNVCLRPLFPHRNLGHFEIWEKGENINHVFPWTPRNTRSPRPL